MRPKLIDTNTTPIQAFVKHLEHDMLPMFYTLLRHVSKDSQLFIVKEPDEARLGKNTILWHSKTDQRLIVKEYLAPVHRFERIHPIAYTKRGKPKKRQPKPNHQPMNEGEELTVLGMGLPEQISLIQTFRRQEHRDHGMIGGARG